MYRETCKHAITLLYSRIVNIFPPSFKRYLLINVTSFSLINQHAVLRKIDNTKYLKILY